MRINKSEKKYFEDAYKWSLKPVKDISFSLYSANTWKTFQKYISDNKTIIDLGCGAGVLLYNINKIAKKYNNCNVLGYDFSEEAILYARKLCPEVKFVIGDVVDTKFEDNTFDIVASTMTIEHVDDEKFIEEVSRIIKPKGAFLLNTVMKTDRAWYYLKDKNGESVLELTHLREYTNTDELISKLEKYNFKPAFLETPRIKFSILDFILLRLARRFKNKYFLDVADKDIVVKIRKMLKIPIPGYFAIEVIATKE